MVTAVALPGCPAWSNAGPWGAVLRVLVSGEGQVSGADAGRFKTPRHGRFRSTATVTADPATGTIPTGYLILNVTTAPSQRHAGGYVREVPGA